MRRLVLSLAFTAAVSGMLVGCEVEAPGVPAEEQTKSDQNHILGGSPDTVNDAVVLVLGGNSACTGTIIAKNGSTGYVLTAAHCVGMDYVVMDDDMSCLNNNSCDAIWEVNLDQVHPNYNANDIGAGYDFRMLRFSGANASTPVIPPATSPDGVGVGSMTEMVGYGLTENGETDLRMHVTQPVDQLDSFFLAWDQNNGSIGTCSGDSGGPAIFNGKVVAVTSFGDQGCQDIGVSGRVTLVYNDFIAPFIGGQVVETCDSCFDSEVQQPTGECADEVNACLEPETSQCAQLNECYNGCNTAACYDGCDADHPAGVPVFNAIITCWCNTCADVCEEQCDGGSTNTVTVSSTGNGMMTTSGMGGATGAGGEGNGATSSDGGSNGEGGGAEDDGVADGPCDCATAGSNGGSSSGAAFGLAALAMVLGAARRRRR